jgi:diaminohydroxyphosphoribosylaminopyrimidine deaminase/5-amino-6-(5-phosphoribosylamino)uracil reductase
MLAPPVEARTAKQPHWLTGTESRAEVQRMRYAADAVLTGIGTVLADDPALTDRSGIVGPGGRARRRPLLRTILDSRLRTPLDSQLVRSANGDVLIFCGTEPGGNRAAALEAAGVQVERVAGKAGLLDLGAVLDSLGGRQIISLLLECGSELNGAFLGQGLVDKVVLFYSETELGEQAVPFAAGVVSSFLLEQGLHGVSRRTFGMDVCVSGYLRDPWHEVGAGLAP